MKNWNVSIVLLLSVLVFGCGSKYTNISSTPDESGTHLIEFYKVQIAEDDFNRGLMGNPLELEVSILENGKKVGQRTIKGTRGERFFQRPIYFTVKFSPKKNYQILIAEQALLANTKTWRIPPTPKIGVWPICFGEGKVEFGNESYLCFRDRVLKPLKPKKLKRRLEHLKSSFIKLRDANNSYRTQTGKAATTPKDFDSKITSTIPKDILRDWNVLFNEKQIRAYSLFTDIDGNRQKYAYNLSTGAVTSIK
jgi:hypothetical protein